MNRQIIFEGFIETNSGNDRDMNLLLARPVRRMTHPGNDGGIDQLVENLCIDVWLGETLKDDESIDAALLFSELSRTKQGDDLGMGAIYWKRHVELLSAGDDTFEIRFIERVGAGA
jgi:hypothetical protein